MPIQRIDQRNSSTITPYKHPKRNEDADFDFFGTLAIGLGPAALLFKYRELSIMAVVFSLLSLLNKKSTEGSVTQSLSSFVVSLMSLSTIYLNLYIAKDGPFKSLKN